MAKFKVKVLGVLGINNKVYKAGDIVYDYNFPEGNAKKLLEEGKLVSEESKSETSARIKAEKEADEKAKAKVKEEADKKAKEEADALIKAEKEANEKAKKEAK